MLSENLRRYRLENNLSKTELGRRAKVSPRTIEFIETGKIDNPTLKTLLALSIPLNTSIADLVK